MTVKLRLIILIILLLTFYNLPLEAQNHPETNFYTQDFEKQRIGFIGGNKFSIPAFHKVNTPKGLLVKTLRSLKFVKRDHEIQKLVEENPEIRSFKQNYEAQRSKLGQLKAISLLNDQFFSFMPAKVFHTQKFIGRKGIWSLQEKLVRINSEIAFEKLKRIILRKISQMYKLRAQIFAIDQKCYYLRKLKSYYQTLFLSREELYKSGAGQFTDLANLKNRLNEISILYETLKVSRVDYSLKLSVLFNRNSRLVDLETTQPQFLISSLKDLQIQALRENPSLKIFKKKRLALETSINLVKTKLYPELTTLSAVKTPSASSFYKTKSESMSKNQFKKYSELDFTNSFLAQLNHKKLEVNEKILDMKNKIKSRLDFLKTQLKTLGRNVNLLQNSSIKLLEKDFDSLMSKYESGSEDYLTISKTEESLLKAKFQLIDLRKQKLVVSAQIQEITGLSAGEKSDEK